MNHRHLGGFDGGQHSSGVRQDELTIVGGAQVPHPAIEELRRRGAGLNLRPQVLGGEDGEAHHQIVPGLRFLVHEPLRAHVVP